MTFHRPKTGLPRRAKLWPETVAALRESFAKRPEPKDPADANCFYITKPGNSWSGDATRGPIAQEFRKLVDGCGLHKGGRGFYAVRHSYLTAAEETGDWPAVRLTMGHAFRHRGALPGKIGDARLERKAARSIPGYSARPSRP